MYSFSILQTTFFYMIVPPKLRFYTLSTLQYHIQKMYSWFFQTVNINSIFAYLEVLIYIYI